MRASPRSGCRTRRIPGFHDAPVFARAALRAGNVVEGPAVIEEVSATTRALDDVAGAERGAGEDRCVVEARDVGSRQRLEIDRRRRRVRQPDRGDARMTVDPITLEVLRNALEAVACSAWATSWARASKIAVEASMRSLMFGEKAVSLSRCRRSSPAPGRSKPAT
jgi:hypothetical protein